MAAVFPATQGKSTGPSQQRLPLHVTNSQSCVSEPNRIFSVASEVFLLQSWLNSNVSTAHTPPSYYAKILIRSTRGENTGHIGHSAADRLIVNRHTSSQAHSSIFH